MQLPLIPQDRSHQPTIVETVPLASIKRNPNNARVHDRKQLEALVRSVKEYGFNGAVIVDENSDVLCGHARLSVAEELQFRTIPIIRLTHLSESQKRAYRLADNKLAELGGWDEQSLKRELQFLSDLDIDFDFSAIGFDTAEVDLILGDSDQADAPANLAAEAPDVPAISKPGDLWHLGEHRLFCGSALEETSYQKLLAHDRAQMVFTHPPSRVPIDPDVRDHGALKHCETAVVCGEVTDQQYTNFLSTSLTRIQSAADDGSICFVCMNWRHTRHLLTAAHPFALKNICVWVKNNGGLGSFYRSQHEFVFVLKCGTANHINNVELSRHGRNRTDVWEYPRMTGVGGDKFSKVHLTVKPVALVADAIKDCSKRGDVILDPFGGAGTTLIAAEKTKRRAALIELEPRYCDAIVRRWQTYIRAEAIHAETGARFSERERSPSSP